MSPISKRDSALLALLEGKTQTEAAACAGVSSRTVRRWLRDADFVADLDQLRRRRFARTLDRLAAAGEASVEALRSIASDPTQPPMSRIAAARTLLTPVLQPTDAERTATTFALMQGAAGEDPEAKRPSEVDEVGLMLRQLNRLTNTIDRDEAPGSPRRCGEFDLL